MRFDRTWKSKFGGTLGQELNALADAIRTGQIIPSAGMQIKQSSNGTVIIPKASKGGSSTSETTASEFMVVTQPTANDVPTGFDHLLWDNSKQLVLLGTPSDADGTVTRASERYWIAKPSINDSDIATVDGYYDDAQAGVKAIDFIQFDPIRTFHRLPKHQSLFSVNGGLFDIKLSTDYQIGDVILAEPFPSELSMNLGDTAYPVDATYYDSNLMGRFWVQQDYPDNW